MTEEAQDPYIGVKRLRKFLIVVLVIFCLFSLAYSLVTLNFLREPLEKPFGGMLKIKGDIKLGLDGFYPTLIAHDVAYDKIALKKAEMRAPLAQPSPGKPIETHVIITGLTLPGRPPIDIDLPGNTDKTDGAIENFRLSSGDGEVTGSATYRSGALDVTAAASKLDYGLFYPAASGGAVDGTLAVQSSGGSQYQLVQSLEGHLALKGGKGKVPGRALGLWSGNVLAALLPNDAVVNCTVAEFDVKNGIATVSRLGIDTENLNITGTGTIDFNTMYMNMVFTPQPKIAGTVNTAVPLEVSGVFGEVTATPVGAPVTPNTAAPSPCQVSP